MSLPYSLSDYDYVLPEELIAQNPPLERGASRLLVVDRNQAENKHSSFACLTDFLPEKCLLIANNSGVVPARLFGQRPGNGKVELLLLTPPPILEAASTCVDGISTATALVLLKPGKQVKLGDVLRFGDDLQAKALTKLDFGKHEVLLTWQGKLSDCLERQGTIPLPPYIKRPVCAEDQKRYQTIYFDRQKSGSVAAPTAGLHFNQAMREQLRKNELEWAELTLHVGYGTFSPVREQDIRQHTMHEEYVEIPATTAQAIARAKQQGRKIIAVGTTSVRSLEGAAASCGGQIPAQGWSGQTSSFIYPGHEFICVDGMLTNFHLPKSSLLMLVAALAGHERILAAYREAVAAQYRFFSYGDAMLIL